jgi:hypothetical protein
VLPLAFTFALVGGNPSETAAEAREPSPVGPVVLGAGVGAVTGAAVGVGTAFAVVYGTNNNGCYFGGCDAPLLSAVGFSVVTGIAGAIAGGTAGGIIGWSLSE